MKLKTEDFNKITQTITEAEKKTRGEIVTVLLKSSDFYPAAHLRLAILISFLCGLLAYYLFPLYAPSLNEPLYFFYSQIAGLFLGHALCYIPLLKRGMILPSERQEEVHQRALQAFFENNLHQTSERTGILIFISFLERKVEILADIGIHQLVNKELWDEQVKQLIDQIHQQKLVQGLCQTITDCGQILAQHFPQSVDQENKNELKNDLIN